MKIDAFSIHLCFIKHTEHLVCDKHAANSQVHEENKIISVFKFLMRWKIK